MKNRVVIGLIYIVGGILTGLIPKVLLPVCDSEEMKMACYYTGQAAVGLGIAISVLGLIFLLGKEKSFRSGISIAQLLFAILVLLNPLALTGLCKMETMQCRVQTLPGFIVTAILLAVVSIVNVLYLNQKETKDE